MRLATKLLSAAAVIATLGIAGSVAADSDRRAGPGPRGLDFATLDSDGDGAVSRAEMTARGTERLAGADTNGDGRLDRNELIAAMPERPAMMDLFGPDRAAGMADRMIARFGDGESGDLVIAEMVEQQVGAMFARLDADNDGSISAAELDVRQGRQAARGDGAGHGPRDRGWRHD